MKKALFLDRDGVLNRERGDYTYLVEDFEVLPDVSAALKLAKKKGYLLIVISKQGGIAKGLFDENRVEKLHGMMCDELAKDSISFERIRCRSSVFRKSRTFSYSFRKEQDEFKWACSINLDTELRPHYQN